MNLNLTILKDYLHQSCKLAFMVKLRINLYVLVLFSVKQTRP